MLDDLPGRRAGTRGDGGRDGTADAPADDRAGERDGAGLREGVQLDLPAPRTGP